MLATAKKAAQEESEQKAKELISIKSAKAAAKKHEPSRKVKKRAIELYIESTASNRTEAVDEMLPTLESYAAQLNWKTKPGFFRTVYGWLTNFDKERRKEDSLPAD